MSDPGGKEEAARLKALRDLRLLDTPPSESFDRITRMASHLFDLPIAAVSLTDSDRQWFKSRVGVDHPSIPRDKAPCGQVAETSAVLVIEDMLDDPCYRDSLLAQNGIRFYAGSPLTTTEGHSLGAVCVLGTVPRKVSPAEIVALNDLAAMVMAQIELQHAFGRIDPISGLPNRLQFLEDLGDLSRDHHPGEQRIAVLIDLIGMDQLNHVSRVVGSAVIDEMVKGAAQNLQALLGDQRTAYHVGATQLACLAPADLDVFGYSLRLADKAERLRGLAGRDFGGTPAIGIAPFVLGDTTPADVLRIAQGAAQDARASGTLFSIYSTEQDSAFKRSFTLLRDYEATIRDPKDLQLFYQPRIDLASGRCVGAEALLRWTHPTLGSVSPGEFIPLIEHMSLAQPTTAWVVETAVAQLSRWQEAGMDLAVSVNISAANLHDSGFVGLVRRVLHDHGVRAESLELEITETAVMNDAERALVQLGLLEAAGVGIAIDDFGTGYSSLSYLQRLPVRVVKIDRSFIKDIAADPRQMALATMMIDMAKHLGHRVVAEGVETETVLERLRDTACDEIQGFVFARPMPADTFEAWFRTRGADGVRRNGDGWPSAATLGGSSRFAWSTPEVRKAG